MAKVDVIIPYFNAPVEYVRAAVESVLAQTFPHFRCVVVNDGSTAENTAQLEALLAGFHDSRIVCVTKQNGGAASARNAGIQSSDAPYIALLDADDMWCPRRLELQVPLLDSNPDVALVHGGCNTLTVAGHIEDYHSKAYLNGLTQREQLVRMLHENIVAVGTSLFRRSSTEAVGGFDETFRNIEDKDFFVRLLVHGCNFLYLDEPVAIYRMHAENKSGNVDHMMLARRKLIEKMDGLIQTRPDVRGDWPRIRKDMLRHVFQEAAEKCLERRQYEQALRFSLPPQGGFSRRSGRVAAAAVYAMVARRSRH